MKVNTRRSSNSLCSCKLVTAIGWVVPTRLVKENLNLLFWPQQLLLSAKPLLVSLIQSTLTLPPTPRNLSPFQKTLTKYFSIASAHQSHSVISTVIYQVELSQLPWITGSALKPLQSQVTLTKSQSNSKRRVFSSILLCRG